MGTMARTPLTFALVALLAAAAAAAQNARAQLSAAKGLTAVAGLRVGHFTLSERPTGCTVIMVDGAGATGGVSQRGGAPGTRETDLLGPLNMVDRVNAIVLSGGSAYGLDAAQGTMRYLEERVANEGSTSYGRWVEIDHGSGYRTRYAQARRPKPSLLRSNLH